MRKLCLVALLFAAAVPGLAGDVNVPGAPAPPPTTCTGCSNAATDDVSTVDAIELAVIELLANLLTP